MLYLYHMFTVSWADETEMVAVELLNVTFVLIVAGQSNTHVGFNLERIRDSLDFSRVLQIPSNLASNNPPVIPVREGNIGHFSKRTDKIGFITRTAVKYRDNHVGSKGRVVIIPAGAGGSGWSNARYNANNHWRADGAYFKDLVARIGYARDQMLGEFPAFLWHQGESDVGTLNYKYILQTFISAMREHMGVLDCPFVLGEMVSSWVAGNSAREAQQAIINSVTKSVPHTAVVSSEGLSAAPDRIHFTAASQRELGIRYYHAIDIARANSVPIFYTPPSSGTHLVLNHKISTGGYFASVLHAYYEGNTPTDAKYSRLGELWKFRNVDGWYKLKVENVDSGKTITWRQKINPLGAWRDSYVPIDVIENSLGISEGRFQGLVVMTKRSGSIPTLLTADTHSSAWWFAVGMVFHFGKHPLNYNPRITADHIRMYAIVDWLYAW